MTTDTRKRYDGSFEPAFSIGDLVTVDGYPGLIYEVRSFTHCHYVFPDHEFTELEYEIDLVYGEDDSEWLDVYTEDLTLVAKATEADEWLRRHKRKMERKGLRAYGDVDAMLDKLGDMIVLRDMIGGRRYERRIAVLKERIRRATR